MTKEFDAQAVLGSLKPFQRKTADYVWDRFRSAGTRRFLVADEVGLGKTIVAKGVIAHLIGEDNAKADAKDIVYICSNEAIARQNLGKLNLLGNGDKNKATIASRLTLLPFDKRLAELDGGWRFLSFTPGTTFHSGRSSGQAGERALIWHLLEGSGLHSGTKNALLRGEVKEKRFEDYKEQAEKTVRGLKQRGKFFAIHEEFLRRIKAETSSPTNKNECLIAEMGRVGRACKTLSEDMDPVRKKGIGRERNQIVGRLREMLSEIALSSIKPRLVIFDEFQRFAELFDEEDEATGGGAALMRSLLEREGTMSLFLSATPYRMLTLRGDRDAGEEHHKALLKTIAHLHGQSETGEVATALKAEFSAFRKFLHDLPEAKEGAKESKSRIEGHLKPVMSRTERANNTLDGNSMVEDHVVAAPVEKEDLADLKMLSHLASKVGSLDLMEFWKSAPYLLDFMSGYTLNSCMERFARKNPDDWAQLDKLLASLRIDRKAISQFKPIKFRNGRVRALVNETVGENGGLAKRLWLPPTLPYLKTDQTAAGCSKSLVFSEWNMVPDALVGLLSYEAERVMTEANRQRDTAGEHEYFSKDTRVLLPIKLRDEAEKSSFSLVPLIYPSRFLAKLIDPLKIAKEFEDAPDYVEMRERAVDILREALAEQFVEQLDANKRPKLWECVRYFNEKHLGDDERIEIGNAISRDSSDTDEGDEDGSSQSGENKADNALLTLIQRWHEEESLGDEFRVDETVLGELADLALGSPAICAYRALRRLDDSEALGIARLQAAVNIARGFRTLFNRREAVGMLKPRLTNDWVSVVNYCAEHDLQAVLDEYVYVLLGDIKLKGAERIGALSSQIRSAVATQSSSVLLREPVGSDGEKKHLRGHFAMRLADSKGVDKESPTGKHRSDAVRGAFNSPFRPFVLVSTSVGQEGLDFHHYCSNLWHWNVPNNPIDLEQREGRVQRYMNHTVRKNIASEFGDLESCGEGQNPWFDMVKSAENEHAGGNGLSPHWLMDGDAKIRRCVPLPPLSRDAEKFRNLTKSLAVYRLAFGQPRQDDLLKYLKTLEGSKEMTRAELEAMQVSLVPSETSFFALKERSVSLSEKLENIAKGDV